MNIEDIDINEIKTQFMKDFNLKIEKFGVRKFMREGIKNPHYVYRIKNLDLTLSLESIKRYHDKIIDLEEQNEN